MKEKKRFLEMVVVGSEYAEQCPCMDITME
jgi:hypothetical protein